MSRYSRRFQTRHHRANLDRGRAAVIQAGSPASHGAHIPGRPPYPRHTPMPKRPNRLVCPRYTRDGDVIILIPSTLGVGRDAEKEAA